ncbi:MlaD family protein [Caldimonas tepidiphila]|uniref:MlaD family protein n=1 Tax=Caldimonas tepidiphila TaxID=2315841 RepID=UPI000E5A1D02|nr:MlaD family protein [Caldimonas tepidiphila]
METRAHHVVIGAFALGVAVLALGFVLWLTRAYADRGFDHYDVVFTEAVTGLSRGGMVQYNGITVGEVEGLKLAADDPRKVVARVRLDGDTPVKTDTRARLALLGVTGVAFIQLTGGSPQSPLLAARSPKEVPVIVADPSALSKLLNSGEDIALSVNQALLRLGELLSRENVDRVSRTLEHVEAVASTVAGERDELGATMRQLSAATAEMRTTLATLNRITGTTDRLLREDITRLVATTERSVASLERVAASAEQLIENNRGAIDSAAQQGLRQLGPAMSELRDTMRVVRQLGDRLSASDNLLFGRDRPEEYRPK